jgi:alpha-galactosidase
MDEKDLAFCQSAVKTYDSIKSIIYKGNQFRLSDPWQNSVASVMYLDETQSAGVIFNYLVNDRYSEGSKFPIALKGLDPSKKYRISEINLYPGTRSPIDSGKIYSGDFLMKVGFNPMVNERRASVILSLEAVK